jgi:tRNA1Val (adenine37-N6)-methyltransferase
MTPILTNGFLLGGRVRYAQPAAGFRSGIEPVILAAAVPAQPGDRILEAGTASGAALLCLAARVPGIVGMGVDLDPDLIAIATRNAADNDWPGLRFVGGDIRHIVLDGGFDHACANPPYHAAAGTRSPNAARERAKRAKFGLLEGWAASMARVLRTRGTLTFILPAPSLPDCLAAMAAADCPVATVFPLWKRRAQEGKLIVAQGVKGSRASLRIAAGLVLHGEGSAYTTAADDVLRNAAALALR